VAEIRHALKALVELQASRPDDMETEGSITGGIRAVMTPAKLAPKVRALALQAV
jgi:hypothetical protein